MNKNAIHAFILLLILGILLPISVAEDNKEQKATDLEINTSVNQYSEVFISPLSKEEYIIIKDPTEETTRYRDKDGIVYGSKEEIFSSEIQRLSISPDLLKIDEGLRKELEVADENKTVPVIIVFVEQPAHNISLDIQAKYEPIFQAIVAPAKEIYNRTEQRISGEDNLNFSALEQESLSNEEKDQLNLTRGRLDQEMANMRSDILATSTPLVDEIQAPIIEKINVSGGEIGYSGKIYNSLSARVPLNYLVELSQDTSIAMIYTDNKAKADLDVANPAISASTWWNAGYDGGIWDAAVCDTGIDGSHPALGVDYAGVFHDQGKLDGFYADISTSTDDLQGHGTHCAGIVASTDATYKGTAYGLDGLINAKAGWLATDGSGYMYDSDCMKSIDWAILHSGDDADVISRSFGGNAGANGDTALCHYMDAVSFDLQTPVVASAGNDGPSDHTVGEPGSAYNVITVGNVNDQNTVTRSDDVIRDSSSRGPTGDGRLKPDISAPGTGIMSCNNNWESGADFISKTGTSMSTPMVAGSVLLILDYMYWDDRAIKALLLGTAGDMGTAGPDNDYGYGYIDLWHADYHKSDVFTGSLAASPEGAVEKFFRGPIYNGDRATMVWDRHVIYNDASEPTSYLSLSDLDLQLYDESDGSYIDSSASSINNVEQVESSGDHTSSIIKIEPWGTYPSGITYESYALATEEGFTQVNAPTLSASLSVPSGAIGSGTTFSVSTTVSNTGIGAHNVDASLALPSGFSIVSGSNPQSLGTVSNGGSKTATWTLQAPSVSSPQSYTILTSVLSSSYGETYTASNSKTATVGPIIPVYRMYSPANKDHFYTTSYYEYTTTAVNFGYNQEGILVNMFSNPQTGIIPVYRMYSPANKDHFYTTSYYEYTVTAVNYGYIQEGILGYLYSSSQTGNIPIYRMFSPANKDHFLTTSYYEYTVTAVNFGYNQEGILGYGIPYVGLAKEDEIPQELENATEMELDNVSTEAT